MGLRWVVTSMDQKQVSSDGLSRHVRKIRNELSGIGPAIQHSKGIDPERNEAGRDRLVRQTLRADLGRCECARYSLMGTTFFLLRGSNCIPDLPRASKINPPVTS